MWPLTADFEHQGDFQPSLMLRERYTHIRYTSDYRRRLSAAGVSRSNSGEVGGGRQALPETGSGAVVPPGAFEQANVESLFQASHLETRRALDGFPQG